MPEKWTKEAPTRAGWYWLKADPEVWPRLPEGLQMELMVMVYKRYDEWHFDDPVNHETYPCICEQPGRLWAGPLTPPEDAQPSLPLAPDWTNGFPLESDDYERQFYCGTVLDGWYYGGDHNEKFTALNDAIVRACERSTDDDVWGVYQVGKDYNDDGLRDSDRIVAVIFKQNVYLFEPEPKECKKLATGVSQ